MNGEPISWKTRRQNSVSVSTSKAEFVAASQAKQKALFLRETLKDFGYQQNTATEIHEVFLACVAKSKNPVRRIFSRHIDIRRYFVRELLKAGFVKLYPSCKHKMVADALTKSLSLSAFVGHRRVMMGQTPFALNFLHSYCVYCFLLIYFFIISYRSIFFELSNLFFKCPHCAWGRATHRPPTT